MSELKPRNYLVLARTVLGLSQEDAGALIGRGKDTVRRYEQGYSANLGVLRELCRAYQAIAVELNSDPGYTAAEFHETRLCPGEFDLLKEVSSE